MQVLDCVGQRKKGEGEEGGKGLQEDEDFKNNLSLFSFASLSRIEMGPTSSCSLFRCKHKGKIKDETQRAKS